jgi:hypothetical protein
MNPVLTKVERGFFLLPPSSPPSFLDTYLHVTTCLNIFLRGMVLMPSSSVLLHSEGFMFRCFLVTDVFPLHRRSFDGFQLYKGGRFSASFLDNAVVVNAVCAAELQSIFTDGQESSSRLPFAFSLHQNYPNPFNPTTTIRYDLPSSGFVSLKVFDILGREVRTLISEVQDAGFKSVELDASGLSSGVYFYKIQAGNFSASRKMLVAK